MGKPGPDPAVTAQEVLARLRERPDPCAPATAPEVAAMFDVTSTTARDRLGALVQGGELASKKVGARGRVYWIPHARARE